MTVTDILAIWGAILSTVTVVIALGAWIGSRCKLDLQAMLGEMHPSDDDRIHLMVTVTNTGRRPVALAKWGIANRKKPEGGIVMEPALPRTLQEGEVVDLMTHSLWMLEGDFKHIVVWAAAGKQWRLSRKKTRYILSELADLKAKGLIDESQLQAPQISAPPA